MKIDFGGLEAFYRFLEGRQILETVLQHPAYQAIFTHTVRYGEGLCAEAVTQALEGQPSPFYGLDHLRENLPCIKELEANIRQAAPDWCAQVESEVRDLLPAENLEDIRVYPVIGYDMGIGLGNAVCMNLNTPAYLKTPQEFLYYMIHETMHVLYERSHSIPALHQVTTPQDWQDYFALWVQNEGFAVYAPLRPRTWQGNLDERDYRVLMDPVLLAGCLEEFWSARRTIFGQRALAREEFLTLLFGEKRLTYRCGCEIIRRVQERAGPVEVTRAFYMEGADFLAQYEHLLL